MHKELGDDYLPLIYNLKWLESQAFLRILKVVFSGGCDLDDGGHFFLHGMAGLAIIMITMEDMNPDPVEKLSEANHRLSLELAERKHAEEALRESEEKLRTVINASPDGIVMASLEGILQWVSPRILKMWGYDTSEEMVGHNLLEYIAPAEHEKVMTHISQMLNGTFTGRAEYRMVRKDGNSFFSEANTELLRDTQGNVTGFLFTQRDVSERVRVEKMLVEARRTAEAANRELKDALAREEHLARSDWLTGILNHQRLTWAHCRGRHLASAVEIICRRTPGSSRPAGNQMAN